MWWKLRRLKQKKSKRGWREQRLRRDDRSTTTVTVATVAKKKTGQRKISNVEAKKEEAEFLGWPVRQLEDIASVLAVEVEVLCL